jgi:phosphatidylinositol-3-phosphatase
VIRRVALVAVLAAAAALGGGVAQAPAKVPYFKHVFVVVLENENASTTFGPNSQAPYLAKTLKSKGAFVPNYYGTVHNSMGNYVAMVSGQSPNIQTQADCPLYNDNSPGTITSSGQVLGTGCIYPPGVQNVGNQLGHAGYKWGGYFQDMNAIAPKGQQAPCRHPTVGELDPWQHATPTDEYATRHNPFVYFHSLIDFQRTCAHHVVDYTHLRKNLKRGKTSPNYALLVPGLCDDGHDAPCANGDPGGLVSANRWLSKKVPVILHSHAFKHRGLLIVTFDEAEATGSEADSSACCGEQPGPSIVPPNTPGFLTPGPGGGRIGAVMVSPCIKPGTVSKEKYNHYSLLRSIERNFQLPYLGYAGQAGLRSFGGDIFTRPNC